LFGFLFQPPPNNLHRLFPCVNHSAVSLFLLQTLSPGIIGCLPTSVSAAPYCQTRQKVEQLRSTHWSLADFVLLPQTAYVACLGPALSTAVAISSQIPNKLHYVRPLHTTGLCLSFPVYSTIASVWPGCLDGTQACLTGPKPPCSYQHFSPGGYLYSFT